MARFAISFGGLAIEMEDEDVDVKDLIKMADKLIERVVEITDEEVED